METQKLQKSVMIRRVRWHLILSYALAASFLLNVIQYAGSSKEDVRPRYSHEYVASDFKHDRLVVKNADLRATPCRVNCHAAVAAVPAPRPVVAFDAVDPYAVYYGCLDLMSRMEPPVHGIAPNLAREYALRTCAEAAEWSFHHPGDAYHLL